MLLTQDKGHWTTNSVASSQHQLSFTIDNRLSARRASPLQKKRRKEKFNFTYVLEAHKLGVKWTDEKAEIEVSLTAEPNNSCTDASLGKMR